MRGIFNRIISSARAEMALEKLGIAYENDEDRILVRGDIDLSNRNLDKLPDLSRVTVHGNFNCSGNRLTSLKGAPELVRDNFDCSHNRLISLEGATKEVGGNFSCSDNALTSLKGAPERLSFGSFDCSGNPLGTMMFAPRAAGGTKSDFGDFTLPVAPAPQQVPASPVAEEPSAEPQAASGSPTADAATLQAPLSVRRPLTLKR